MYAGVLPTGFVLTNATAIDNNGDIVGYGTDASDHTEQAFLLRTALPGDANLDGKVDINDLTIVLSHYGQSTGMSWSTGDFIGDGTVNINDLTIVLANYNRTARRAALAAVPEPGTWALLAAGLVALSARAWRERDRRARSRKIAGWGRLPNCHHSGRLAICPTTAADWRSALQLVCKEMSTMIRMATIVLSVVLAATAANALAGGHYFVDLSALAGNEVANPCGVNSSGGVTGMYVTTATPAHMFLYTGGTTGSMNDLTADFITSGGLISSAINDSGQLAVNRNISGWLYGGGLTGTATLLPGDETSAIAINSQGNIGGDHYQPTGDYRVPIVYSGGTVYQLNAPHAGISSTILALNSSGQACGINRNGMCATVWTYAISGGSIASQSATDISPYLSAALTGYEASQAYAINDSGDVVGDWSTTYRADQIQMTGDFLYNTNTHAVTSLPLTFATQLGLGYLYDGAGESGLINDAGQVVGQITVDSVPHAAI